MTLNMKISMILTLYSTKKLTICCGCAWVCRSSILVCPLYQETVAGGFDQTMQEILRLQPTLACTMAVSASTSGGSANMENKNFVIENGNNSNPI